MKRCTVDGCPRPHRARGLCSTHYNQQFCPARHPKVTASCSWCDKTCRKATTKRYPRRFCSLACRDNWRSMLAGTNVCHLTKWNPGHPDYRPPLPVPWVKSEPIEPSRSTIRWVAGFCRRCGSPFIAEDYTDTARYCSVRCAKRVTKQRYRARKKDAYVADVSPARIFERDGWRCRLCRRKVRRDKAVPHPRAPVLDHIVPLARGGTHEPANVQCAHFICNSKKSDGASYAEQLLLIG